MDGGKFYEIFGPSAQSWLKRESTGWGRESVNWVYVNELLVNKHQFNPGKRTQKIPRK